MKPRASGAACQQSRMSVGLHANAIKMKLHASKAACQWGRVSVGLHANAIEMKPHASGAACQQSRMPVGQHANAILMKPHGLISESPDGERERARHPVAACGAGTTYRCMPSTWSAWRRTRS